MLGAIDAVESFVQYGRFEELLSRDGDEVDPDVVIVSCSGCEQPTEEIRRAFPSCRILALVASGDSGYLAMATNTRADGYLMLDDLTEASLRDTLPQLTEGSLPLPAAVASYLLERTRTQTSSRLAPYYSPRERDVIELLLEGLGNQEIAQRLGISIHGVKRHVSSVLNKANSPSRAHFVAHALRSEPPLVRG
jgi:two-component system nitrate/nitrite response regulator NarL